MNSRLENLPPKLREVVTALAAAPKNIKLEILLDFAKNMPKLPEGMQNKLEQVDECTTPFFVHVEMEDGGLKPYFDAPPEAPTVRAFAGMLAEGLTGASAAEVLAVPEDFYVDAKLSEIVTPLRLRGLEAVLRRIKRQVKESNVT